MNYADLELQTDCLDWSSILDNYVSILLTWSWEESRYYG